MRDGVAPFLLGLTVAPATAECALTRDGMLWYAAPGKGRRVITDNSFRALAVAVPATITAVRLASNR